MSRIALDAMGGDHAPAETVAGGVAAAREGADVLLVGDESTIRTELDKHAVSLPVHHASEVVGMGDDPARALREKPASSVAVCARLVESGEAAGFVSAGSTGAAMAAAAIVIGRISGVLRPTIASVFPTPGTPTVVLDSGANPEVKPEHLYQFALMGAVLSEVYFGVIRPRIGLLNNGEESSKGRDLERSTYRLLSDSPLNFIGNVEGRVIATDAVDVIVTDGFTGNIFLKTTEGAGSLVAKLFTEALSDIAPEVLSDVMVRIRPIIDKMDYENTGGAHLLGTRGVVVIAHGSSSRRAIANALRMARESADHGLVSRIQEEIGRT